MKRKILKAICTLFCIVFVISTFSCVAGANTVTTTYYYDMDFNEGTATNNADTGFGFSRVAGSISFSVVDSALKGNKVYKVDNQGTGQMIIGQNGLGITDLDNKTAYYEMSFMFEDEVVGTDMRQGRGLWEISSTGTFYLGGHSSSPGIYGSPYNTGITIVPDKWYHLKIAIDAVDKSGTVPKIYMWLNGELIGTTSTQNYTMAWTQTGLLGDNGKLGFSQFYVYTNADVLYFDDIKAYSKNKAVRDTEGNLDFDPMAIFDGAEITSDELKIQNNVIYVSPEDTLGDVSEMITASVGAGYFKNGEVKAEDIVAVTADGAKVYAQSTSGIGMKEYTISATRRMYDIDRSTVQWERAPQPAGEEPLSYASMANSAALLANDTIRLKLKFANDTTGAKTNTVVLAAYSGTQLIACSFTPATVPVGGSTDFVVTNPINIGSSLANIKVKAFVWDTEDNKASQLQGISLPSL